MFGIQSRIQSQGGNRDAEIAYIMNRMTLSNIRAPQFILLGKSGLKCKCSEVGVDISLAAAPVTGMNPNYFAKQFFDFGNEWPLSW